MRLGSFIIGLCALFSFALSAEVIREWDFSGGKLPTGFVYDKKQIAPEVKEGSLSLKLLTRPESGPTHSVMAGLQAEQEFKGGVKYRLTFMLRSDRDAQVGVNVQLIRQPYPTMPGSGKTINVNTDWTPVELVFIPREDIKGPFRTPQLQLGRYPVGATLELKSVKVEQIGAIVLPLNLNTTWNLEINDTRREVIFTDDALDIAALQPKFQVKSEAILINEFDAPEDGVMQIGCAADWWFDFAVNGKSIYSTLATGNQNNTFAKHDHVFNFPVRKGKNRIEVKVLAGSKGWKFVCGAVLYMEKLNRITEIVRGAEWRPLKMDQVEWDNRKLLPQRIDQFKIIPGSALDLSQYLPKYDIDKLGRVVNRDGRLGFANAPGITPKFRGFNFASGRWEYAFYKMSKPELEELAEQIRLHGMNVVRFHYLDYSLCGNNGMPKKDKKKLEEVLIPQETTALPIDQQFLDRHDYFIKCLRDRGIYVLVDIVSSYAGWTAATELPAIRDNFRYGLFISPEYRKNYRAGFDSLMNRINPYTQNALKDDPQCIGITFFNEQEHLFSGENFKAFDPEWKGLRGKDAPEFNERLLLTDSSDGIAARQFLLAQIKQMNQFYLDTATESGFKGFVTLWDMFMRNLEGVARQDMNATAMHTYFAHPKDKPLWPEDYQQQLRYGRWLRGQMSSVAQGSAIGASNLYLGRAAVCRMPGKPFFLTEYSHCAYNANTFESGLMVGATAALQGWDMLTPHARTVGLYYTPLRAKDFDDGMSPMAKLSSLLTAFAFQRGDVATGRHPVNFTVDPQHLNSPDLLKALAGCYNQLYMLAPVSTSYSGPVKDAFNVPAQYFIGAVSMGMHVQLEDDKLGQYAKLRQLVTEMKRAGVLPPDNRTDVNAGIFQSETGEITSDVKRNVMTIVTPRLEGAAMPANTPVRMNALEITGNSVPCSIAAVSLDGGNIGESKHLLLTIGTMAVAENTVFSTEKFNDEIDVGRMPLLLKSGKFAVKLKNANVSEPKIYALNANGSREREISVVAGKGKVIISMDTSTFEYGTPYFEIIYHDTEKRGR